MKSELKIQDSNRFGKVAVLMGGTSAEREVSLVSGAAVLEGLQQSGIDAHKIDASPSTIGGLAAQGFDRAFIILHGRWGEDGVVQGALQSIGLPYTGSGVLGSALAMDKVRSKQIWQTLGLPTAPYRVVKHQQDLEGLVEQLGLPLFLKPACEGSSVGVGKVIDKLDLFDVWQETAKIGDDVLAEAFIPGAELTVGILDGKTLPTIRMSTGNEFYDYQAKYHSDETQCFCPAGLPEALEAQVQALAMQAFEALACESWGRVDLMLDANNKPVLLEVNTVPGMTDHSLVPIAAAASGISFESLLVTILEKTL